ncbi:NADH-dependent alcohol dehydrogenase [Parasaccharibacter sp. TMW2.1882]|uniref:NADH-dependent alcohol dehydrogenase n=1 Tax=Parasaccharibacter apium TaxID=1510841 RepID=A0ABX4ZMA6_9PROT|nr:MULTISPECIES: iron-containing alcohol dehydrogenase [Acetobacteraceae]MCL1563291.1 iron-containing alcohol dehydrogenase [Parasaccharibacter sp. TMW 2.1886]MCQ0042095.1 iron-containing alcohol dehydrogenase [Bombella sp.]MUG80131.1 iron-containing alcohol dehydrogenase [Bombella sp. ESL0380]MUH03482.1 iron-containing alcohol dehydrogenase [Bombella sp. ESL0387]QGT75701.1 iron-containing alcohol dehydrogenase [Bombella sp. ESL0368]
MDNFEFYNPTKILFGKGMIARLDEQIDQQARVLVLYGGASAEKSGTLGEVRKALGQRTFCEFGGIEANPTYETLMKAVEVARKEKVNFLLAVGGGSVMDGTKFVAAAVPYQGEPWEILLKQGETVQQALPLGTVVTLPATGSEMNSIAVISRKETGDKLAFSNPHVFPVFSILDPTRTFSLPPRQVANGVADSFVHVMEAYMTLPQDAMVQDRYAEGLLLSLHEIGQRITSAPADDYDLRANLMWVATQALNGLIGAGVKQDWATHAIGHELTAKYGIDHARTLAIVFPAMLKERREQKRAKLLQYAARVLGLTEGTEDERIDAAIARIEAFFEGLEIPVRLSAYDIDRAGIDPIIAQLEEHGMTTLGEHQDITSEISRKVLERSL